MLMLLFELREVLLLSKNYVVLLFLHPVVLLLSARDQMMQSPQGPERTHKDRQEVLLVFSGVALRAVTPRP